MTLPRQILDGTTYLLTRRCTQRQFLLRPDDEVDQVFVYCLARAATRWGIRVHALWVGSNHYHAVITDRRSQLAKFAGELHGNVARALNVRLKRGENFWAPGSYSAVTLSEPEDVLAKLVYTITNAVASGLVSRPEDWPGARTLPEDCGRRVLEAARPAFFFRQEQDEAKVDDPSEETARDRARRREGPKPTLPARVSRAAPTDAVRFGTTDVLFPACGGGALGAWWRGDRGRPN